MSQTDRQQIQERTTREAEEEEPPLVAENLEKYFSQSTNLISSLLGSDEPVQAVDDVSLRLHRNQVIGVIGESGCGKTTLLETLMGLNEPTGGEIRLEGKPTSEFSREDWKEFRRKVQIIFQDPFNSLDPKMTVRESLREPLKIHDMDNHEERIREALDQVELRPPDDYIDKRPFQLSGGEQQRASIARALIVEPEIILADEPVSMLDVSTQAAVLSLLADLTDNLGVAMLYISHDLSTVSYVCDRVNVMYLGRIVESAETIDLLEDPKHPYTQALINAVPIPNPHRNRKRADIAGDVPDPIGLGEGCRFRDRCPERMEICDVTPDFVPIDDEETHYTSCHLYYDHQENNA